MRCAGRVPSLPDPLETKGYRQCSVKCPLMKGCLDEQKSGMRFVQRSVERQCPDWVPGSVSHYIALRCRPDSRCRKLHGSPVGEVPMGSDLPIRSDVVIVKNVARCRGME